MGGKGERRASEAREDRTREDLLPPAQPRSQEDPGNEVASPLILTFLPPFLRPATQASGAKDPAGEILFIRVSQKPGIFLETRDSLYLGVSETRYFP